MPACSHPDCVRPHKAKGYCAVHYARLYRHGNASAGRALAGDAAAAFAQYVAPGPLGCLLWTGSLTDGYGRIMIAGVRHQAHRYAYEQRHGAIPDGLVIDHLCRVRNCVNPDHMQPVQSRENILRGIGLAATEARSATCARGHRWLPGSYYAYSKQRVCKPCRADDQRAYRARRRAARQAEREDPTAEL